MQLASHPANSKFYTLRRGLKTPRRSFYSRLGCGVSARRQVSQVEPSLCCADGRQSGAEGTRTLDPRLAKPMLSQLSYGPRETDQVGARRVELRTSSLSATRSNQLSYAPGPLGTGPRSIILDFPGWLSNRHKSSLSRKPILSYRYRLLYAGQLQISEPVFRATRHAAQMGPFLRQLGGQRAAEHRCPTLRLPDTGRAAPIRPDC